jgi:hypothetical protein
MGKASLAIIFTNEYSKGQFVLKGKININQTKNASAEL